MKWRYDGVRLTHLEYPRFSAEVIDDPFVEPKEYEEINFSCLTGQTLTNFLWTDPMPTHHRDIFNLLHEADAYLREIQQSSRYEGYLH